MYYKYTNKHINRYLTVNPHNASHARYISLPFFGHISYKIKNILQKYNDKVLFTFKTHNSLKQSINNNKDKIPIMNQSGVYKLSCTHIENDKSCNCCYVGRTGRSLHTRINDHLSLIEKHKNKPVYHETKSNFANHILESKHNFDPDKGIKVLHVVNNGKTSNLLEIFEINKSINDPDNINLNEQTQFDCINFFNSLNI